jgi:hypothetical protein
MFNSILFLPNFISKYQSTTEVLTLSPAKMITVGPKCLISLCFKNVQAAYWWLTPVILAIQEAEIRRITV